MKVLRRLGRDARGAAAVEFALIGAPLVFLLIGIIEFGRGLYIRNAVDDVADRAQRAVLIDNAVADAALESEIRAAFLGGPSDALQIEHDLITVSGDSYRVVSIGFEMRLLVPNPVSRTVRIATTRRIAVE